jgi:hypothetical protein
MFSHLRFYTKYQDQLDTAVEHHILLAQVRRAAVVKDFRLNAFRLDTVIDFDAGERIRQACHKVLAENGTSIQELRLRVHIKVALGAVVAISSPVLPLDEAISWRARLLRDKITGWESFAASWIELLQLPRRRRMSASAAAAFVQGWQGSLEPLWERAEDRRIRQSKRETASLEDRQDRRVASATCSLERALAAEKAAGQRVTLEKDRARRKLHRERSRWLGLHGKHLTLAEIMHGYPPHLQG